MLKTHILATLLDKNNNTTNGFCILPFWTEIAALLQSCFSLASVLLQSCFSLAAVLLQSDCRLAAGLSLACC